MEKTKSYLGALRNELAKRVPAILLILVVLLLWQNYQNGQKATATLGKLDKQSQQLHKQGDTITQQNKDIKILTQALNDKTDNINKHVDCIVTLFLPNKYPPTSSDLDGCKASAPTTTSSSPETQSSTQTSQPQPTPSNQAPESNTPQSPGNSENTPAEDNRNVPQRLIDLINPFG